MLVISHRGNLRGPEGDCSFDKVRAALDLGFDVELDVRDNGGELFVGHDRMLYPLSDLWLTDVELRRVWFHAKDWRAAAACSALGRWTFSHASEECAAVANSHVMWLHPDVNPELRSDDSLHDKVLLDVAGYPTVDRESLGCLPFAVCTDWPLDWHAWLSKRLQELAA